MLVEPLAQVPSATYEPVTVAVPVPTKLAVFEENVTTEVLLEVQVVEAVTSVPLREAENTAEVPLVKVVPDGIELIVSPWPPVTLPVADPVTPPTLAVIVTLVADPTPVTRPAFTVAQAVELCHEAEFVSSLLPLSKAAVAKSFTVDPCATVKVLDPPPLAAVVTVTEFG
jgi:hypothetical protein